MTDFHAFTDTEQKKPSVTIITNSAKFALGQVLATPQAIRLLEETGRSAASILAMHMHGEWGDVCKEDAELNEQALANGSRIMSVYRLCDPQTLRSTPSHRRAALPTLWCITDAALDENHPRTSREVTTLLTPSEY